MVDLSMLQAVEAASPTSTPLPPATPVASGGMAGIVKGKVFAPPRLLIYGADGSGKSTLASQAPKPIFCPMEDGLSQLGPDRFPVAHSYPEAMENINAVAMEPHEYKTIVIDSVSWLEKLIFEKVARDSGKDVVTEVGGGFGRGENKGLALWCKVIELLERCRARGMMVILLCHAGKEDAGNPEFVTLKQIAPRLHHKTTAPYLREWVDATIYLTRRMIVNTVGQGFNEKQIAQSVGPDGGERIMVTTGGPMTVSKQRYNLPAELPFPKEGAFDLLMSHISAHFAKKGI